jgi:WD40 repeat protein
MLKDEVLTCTNFIRPLWHPLLSQVLEVLHAHEGTISHLVWSPQLVHMGGEEPVAVLASSSTDRRVRIWRSPKILN